MGPTIRKVAGAAALVGLLVTSPSASYAQAHAHMAFTAAPSATAADTARALEVVRKLRVATAEYPTLEAAGRTRSGNDQIEYGPAACFTCRASGPGAGARNRSISPSHRYCSSSVTPAVRCASPG